MDSEIKALKEVVETFGKQLQMLQQDYIRFRDWIDKITNITDLNKIKEVKNFNTISNIKGKNKQITQEVLDTINNLDIEDDKYSFNINDIL